MVIRMMTDIEIAQGTVLEPVVSVAERIGIRPDDLELYGKYKAKISDSAFQRLAEKPNVSVRRRLARTPPHPRAAPTSWQMVRM